MSKTKRFTISGNLLAYNEIRYIAQVIDNMLAFCDELVIIDGGSTDGTIEYILSLRDLRIKLYIWPQPPGSAYRRGWKEAERRTRLIRLSSCDYIFKLDADELVSDQVIEVISGLVSKRLIGVFPMYHFFRDFTTIRVNTADDRVWYPNSKIRLLPNDKTFFFGSKDPEGLHCRGYKKVGPLNILVSPRYAYWPKIKPGFSRILKKSMELLLGLRFAYYADTHIFHYHYAVGYKEHDLRLTDDARRDKTIYVQSELESDAHGPDTICLKKIQVSHPKAFNLQSE